MAPADLDIRPSGPEDLAATGAIYAHHVLTGLASFEDVPPGAEEMARRQGAALALGLPHLVAATGGRVLGFAYAAPYRARPAYRFTLEDSIYVAEEAVGLKLGRWSTRS